MEAFFQALDLLLFGDLREEEGQRSKTCHISDRMHDMEAGRWSSVWNTVGQRRAHDSKPPDDLETTVRRVQGLMAVKEFSRAASAAWGPSERRTPQEVIRKFATTQPTTPPPRRDRGVPGPANLAVAHADLATNTWPHWAKMEP